MAGESTQADKQVKRQARQLREAARLAFAAGDYRRARELDRQIVRLVPDSELGQEAAHEAQNLRTDPVAIYIGLGALTIYGMAWLLAFA